MKQERLTIISLLLVFCINFHYAQETFPRNDVLDNRNAAFAFTNATIVTAPGETIENGTMLIENGIIQNIGTSIRIPNGYIQIDVDGKFIYPSLIDIHTSYGLPENTPQRGGGRGGFSSAEQIQSKIRGAYSPNETIKSHYNASEEFDIDGKSASDWRKNGFGTLLTFRKDGLARGTSALVTLGEKTSNEALIQKSAAAHYSFNRGTARQNYPGSLMGFISCLRQTYMDADWYAGMKLKPFADQTLDAWISQQNLPQIFDAGGWMNILRADKIGDEFGVQYIIKGGGDEYKRIKEVKETMATLIIPVNFPDAYDVEDPFDAEKVSLADMKHWELAPTNLAVLESNNIEFAITADGLKNKSDLRKNIQKAIKYGLSKEKALSALTTTPARILGVDGQVGSLAKGKIANFLITSGEIFDEKTEILHNWVQGKAYQFKELKVADYAGKYSLVIGGKSNNLEISGEPGSQKAKIVVNDSTTIDVTAKFSNGLVTFSYQPDKKESKNIRLSGWVTEIGWKGSGQEVNGDWINWEAKRTGDIAEEENKERKKPESKSNDIGKVIFPFVAFGNEVIPQQETILIKNATVWTNESSGILENTDVLIKNGKISRIGKNLSENGATIVDGTGKHLTPGIIDEHTHVGGGGNERATNSSMVRIGDQINSEQSNIYRTLAGGVTAAQVLHGSANPIGGQSALVKFRWGQSPENYKIDGADEYIKFALGENVKRSSNSSSIRYPQSRMGVAQVYVDAFTNAREYEKKWEAYNALSNDEKAATIKPRKDLVHETMLEILNGERFITCHSYVQSEINMLMKVAEQFGFKINTFTHILEGYKVADFMAEHGVGAGTFSDWWNYKWEVRYAIPYNAALMHRAGVMTAINSDDANSGRRLNQEAAKAVKYGGVSEEDALKMVTLNPAKLLHLEDQMGSIKVGKDGDVVLWTDHPLSVYAKAEKTIVDGTIYFDLGKDKQTRQRILEERARLIQKMKGEKKSGARMQRGSSALELEFHCDDLFYEISDHQH